MFAQRRDGRVPLDGDGSGRGDGGSEHVVRELGRSLLVMPGGDREV